MAYESPLDPDDFMALYRVHCPICRNNVWAGLEEPPASGEDILAEHDCPGPVDISETPEPPAAPAAPEPEADPVESGAPVSGQPAELARDDPLPPPG